MTEEQLKKIDFAFYMAIANSDVYPLEQREEAKNIAISIGMQLGYYPQAVIEQQDGQSPLEGLPNNIVR